MKALVYTGPEKVEVKDLPMPQPKAGAAKVKITYCGICGSDIGIFSGKHPRAKAPLILGHEFVGVIEEIKDAKRGFAVGDRVTAYPLLSCGHCVACRRGDKHVCKTLGLLGIDEAGAMAEYLWVDEDVLFKVPDEVSDKTAAVLEPFAVIVRELHQSGFKALDSAVICGAGPIGTLTGILLKHCGASRIIVSDMDEARLALCREFGFETVNIREKSIVDYVNETTNGDGADIVYECSGAEASALDATKLCRIGGTICMTGVHKMPHAMNLQDINFKEQKVVGTRVYTMYEFGQAVEYAKVINADLEKVVSHIVPIKESDKVFAMIADPKINTAKVLVDCQAK